MAVGFEMKYDGLRRHLTVTQDGNPVSIYSQFARCNSQMMSVWLPLLPGFCCAEANSAYRVTLRGSALVRLLFRQVFAGDPNCVGFSEEPEVINGGHRLRWAEELAQASGRQLPGMRVQVETGRESLDALLGNGGEFEKRGSAWYLRERPDVPISLTPATSGGAIVILPDANRFPPAPRKNGLGAAVILSGTELRFEDAEDGWLLFRCPRDGFGAFVKMWLEDQLLASWLGGAAQSLAGIHKWPGADGEMLAQKYRLLQSGEPWLDLQVPAKIEIRQGARLRFRKLPEDLKCLIRSDNPDVGMLKADHTIQPMKEGTMRITVRAKAYPEYSQTQKTEIYRYTQVQQVRLAASVTDALVGDQVTVRHTCIPANAHNLSQARWSVQPAGAATMIRPGCFQMKSAGVCTITLTVGKVSGSLDLSVFDTPTGVRLDKNQLSIKLGDNSNCLKTTITPAGSRGGTVRYRVSDSRILDLDTRNGQITPKAEGDAVITATLVDQNNRIIDDFSCNVTILPPKDIITPDGPLVILIICIIGMILMAQAPFLYAFGAGAIAMTAWTMFRGRNVWGYCAGATVIILTLYFMFSGGGF